MKYFILLTLLVTTLTVFGCASTEVCDNECKRERQERIDDMRGNRFNP